MIQDIILPDELSNALASESKDFVVKSRRAGPIRNSLQKISFSIVWLAFMTYFFSQMVGPVFSKDIISYVSEMINESKSTENPNGGYFALAFMGVFFLIGFYMLVSGIIPLFKKGGYFVGTPTRLYSYKKGHFHYTNWDDFTGKIHVTGNDLKGTIILDKRTGYMLRRKSGSDYVPYTVYISGIPDVHEIEKICKRRISEHDPYVGIDIKA